MLGTIDLKNASDFYWPAKVQISSHGQVRCQQRGARKADLQAIFKHADQSFPRGSGAKAISITNKKLKRMGGRTPEGVQTDRLRNLTILVSEDHTVITILRAGNCKKYRRKTKWYQKS
mgnify:CR=1 FL=1